MDTSGSRVDCSECGLTLEVPAEPCPACGSMRRSVFAFAGVAEGTGTVHDPGTLAKRPGGRGLNKPAWERRTGPSRSADGVVRFVVREIDREARGYEETVTDPDGTVHHHDSEPLPDHTRHGSDKPRA